ncbi:hypothetical protein V2J09_007141 [Rumex salicifolius]
MLAPEGGTYSVQGARRRRKQDESRITSCRKKTKLCGGRRTSPDAVAAPEAVHRGGGDKP